MNARTTTSAHVARQFQIDGEFLERRTLWQRPYQRHLLRRLSTRAARRVRYILQRINHNIFKNPVALMENIQRVTAHLAAKVAGEPDVSRRVLTLIPARDGTRWHRGREGQLLAGLSFSSRRPAPTMPWNPPSRPSRPPGPSGIFKSCSPTCPRRGCTTPFPTFTTRPNALPRWNRPSPPMPANRAALAQGRKLNLPCAAEPICRRAARRQSA